MLLLNLFCQGLVSVVQYGEHPQVESQSGRDRLCCYHRFGLHRGLNTSLNFQSIMKSGLLELSDSFVTCSNFSQFGDVIHFALC